MAKKEEELFVVITGNELRSMCVRHGQYVTGMPMCVNIVVCGCKCAYVHAYICARVYMYMRT